MCKIFGPEKGGGGDDDAGDIGRWQLGCNSHVNHM